MTAALATPALPLRRIPAAFAVACALALPVFAAPSFSAWCADALGDRVAFAAARALARFAPALASSAPELDETLSDEDSPVPRALATNQATTPNKTPHAKHGAKPVAVHAIFVSSAQVLALAERRAMPGAVPVRATADHPAGLKLRGVSALGIGMRDGDVLTEAAGERAVSVANVIGAVLAARAEHSAQISGRFYRAGVPYTVTVEQPYPPGT
ncbi:MAG TPA: hypothetical protein VHV51_19625 [Polyangiaceae bacterium]|nr:hypothetical protein [Polyangiaceae bacterium]